MYFYSTSCVCFVVNARFEIMKLFLDFALDNYATIQT